MASLTSISSLSYALTPSEDHGSVPLDFHQLLFNYLRLLRFDTKSMSTKHHIKFDKDLFKVPNQKAFHYVVHFLFMKLNPSKTSEMFRDVWPIVDRKQEAEFRKKVKNWLVELQEANRDTFQFGHINPAIFLSPGGEKFAQLLCALASHVLSKMPSKSPTLAPPSTNPTKNPLMTSFKLQMLRGNLLADIEDWVKITNEFRNDYFVYKQLAGRLLTLYRELCQREQVAKAELKNVIEQSSLAQHQKQSLVDSNNNSVCQELVNEIGEKQACIHNLMKKLLSFEESFSHSWEVVSQVTELNGSKPTLNAGRIIQKLPPNFIERYQNAHSGSQLEFKKRNGQYDFVSLLNLLLFSLTTGVELSNSLNIPSLEDENKKLSELQESIRQQSTVAEQLYTRWKKIEEEQTVNTDRLLLSKQSVAVNAVALHPFTPFRGVFNGDSNFADSSTPPAFRTALGMTPCLAAAAAARPKLLDVKPSRASIDELVYRLPTREDCPRWSAGENSAPTHRARDVPEMRSDKRESGSGGLERGSGRNQCTEADALRSALHRTPSVGSLPPNVHTRLSRGSAASSPVLGRVKQHKSVVQPKKLQRRSVQHVVHEHVSAQKNVTTPRSSRMDAVMERAAENIVFDLISVDSPGAPSAIDPNSSFERNAFASCNLIQRSPEPCVWGEERATSNVELLKMLEIIVSPKRRSSLASKRMSGFGSESTRAADSPASVGWLDASASLAFMDLDNEKGLLDATGASLIDDGLDFSSGWHDSFHGASIALATEPEE